MNKTSRKRVSRRGRESAMAPGGPARRRPGRWYRLTLEGLEDRVMLSQDIWINPAGGDWDTPANWSTGVPTASQDAVIDVAGNVTITHSSDTTDSVHSITASDPITLSGGMLSVAGDFSDTSAVALSGGTLAGATVEAGTILDGDGGTLNGVTLAGTLNLSAFLSEVSIVNNLTLSSGLVETTDVGSLDFDGTQALAGTGEVLFDGGNNPNNRLNVQGTGSVLTIDPHITIDGLTATINAAGGAIDNFGTLSVGSSGGAQGAALSGGTFIIDGAWTNEPNATMKAVNDGNLELDAMGANDEGNVVPSGVWTNDDGATISVTGNSDDGGGLYLQGDGWSNAGTITMTNSSVYLGGTFTLANLGDLTRSGGTVDLTGTLNNTATTLALNDTTGSWVLDGGTINGGTITTTGTAELGNGGSSTLDGPLTLSGTLDENNGGSVTIVPDSQGGGLTLSSGLVETTDIGSLDFDGTQTLAGTGEVLFDGGNNPNNRLNVQGNGSVLTIDPHITIDGLTATINAGGGAIDNFGTLSVGSSSGTQGAALSGGTFIIDGAWTNEPNATMKAVNDGNLVLDAMGANDEGTVVPSGVWTNDAGATISVTGNSDAGGGLYLQGDGWSNAGTITMTNSSVYLASTFTLAVLGDLSRSGGAVDLTGTLNNTGTTLALNDTTGSWLLDGGTVDGGTVTTSGSGVLGSTHLDGGVLNGVTLAGTLSEEAGSTSVTVTNGLTLSSGTIDLAGSATVTFSGTQTLGGTGSIVFADGDDGNSVDVAGSRGSVLTIGPNITVEGNSGSIDAGAGTSFINQGTISADVGGGTFALTGTGWVNSGTIQAENGSSLYLGTIRPSGTGSFTNSGTITDSEGLLYLTSELNNAGSTLALSASTEIYLENGEILGGTVTTSGGAELVATGDGGTLSGVTLAGTLEMASPLLPAHDAGQVTVTGGMTLDSGSVDFGESAVLTFQGNQSLSGTGTVIFDDETGNNGIAVPAGSTLTISPGILVEGDSGTVGSSGAGLITNEGTIEATGGGTLTVQGYTNFAGGTLTGGTWGATGGSTLVLPGADITTSAAGIVLDGAGSQIDGGSTGTTNALAGFTRNAAAGSFTIQNGANFSSSGAFTNAGTLTINSGVTFALGGTGVYTQTGGTTILSSGTLGTAGNQISIEAGTISGPGTIDGNLTNAGELDLGSLPGTLTVNGNYTQTTAGALAIKIGGASAGTLFDQVNVTGTAALGGTLDVSLSSGFAPSVEEYFDVVNFAGSSGSFSTFDFPLIGGSPAFVTNTTATSLNLVGATTAADLAVGSVAFTPADALSNQNVTVTYTVANVGTVATTAGTWTDSVYLSIDPTVDASAVLLGRVTHTGNLTALAQYTATLTAALPGLTAGSYRVIVVADSGLQVPDINRANNTGVATTELSTQPPTLTIGTPLSGTIANGQDLYYRLNVAPGTSVKLDATFAVAVESEFRESFGALPTENSFDQSATNLNDLQPEFILPSGQGGSYYIWLHGREGAGAGRPFTLLASLTTFAASAFTPSSASDQGQVTMAVTGSEFTSQTTVSLQDSSGHTLNAQTVTLISANELNATFDLTSLQPGSYDVVATDSGKSSTASGSFQVTAQDVPSLLWTLTIDGQSQIFFTNPPPPTPPNPGGYTSPQVPPTPIFVGAGESSGSGGGGGVSGSSAGFVVSLSVKNLGTNNADIPSVELLVTNAFIGSFVMPAATLAPGETDGVGGADETDPQTPGTSSSVSVQELPTQSALDWASVVAGPRPANISLDAWTAILDNLVASVGQTESSLDAALQADAIYLAQVGDPITDEPSLIAFELNKAEDTTPMPILSSSVDSSFAEPGLPLTFERSFQQPIPYRYQLGTLGYGWTSNWNITATTDQNGNVFIQQGALTSEFLLLSNKSYLSASGNNQEVLTLANGSYTLRGSTGSVTAFLPDGQLNYVQDSNGNRVTAGYTSGLLTSLTHSDGDKLTFDYNTHGLISQITDPAGNVTKYTYDANDQLISVANAQGTTQYTYVNGQAIAQEHAIASITYPDGTHSYFSYDAQGRLIEQSQGNGANAVKYAYLSPGGYTETDANGATTKVLNDLNGQPAIVTDPLGNVSRVTYNANDEPLLTAYPGGTASSDQYDDQGNLVSQTNPLGNTSQFTTDPQTGDLQTFQNANGATTSFSYTSQGELASITQPDNTASSYVYDAQGQVIASTDAMGRVTHYDYDGQGRLIEQNNPDGTYVKYAYDSNNNVISVTDASGSIDMTYDSANRLTEISYPNGQFLKYRYNAGGQLTQMVDQTGFAENYAYNTLGQLVSVTDAGGNLIVSYSYDLAGQLVGEVHGNGTYTTDTYDANGNVLTLVNFAPNASINSSFLYTYNALNLVTSMTTAGGTTTYGYDADGQLTSVVLPTGETITYQYDAMGNRTVVSDNGATTKYTSDNTNEYTSVGSATYKYDLDGNLTMTTGGPGGNTTYTYDDENRLIEEKTPTDIWTFQYNALGSLIASTHNGQTTQYLVNPLGLGNVAAEYDGSGNLIANFTYGVGLVSQVGPSGAAEYYDYNALGSTAGLSGQAGHYLTSYSYLPSGQIQTTTGTAANPFQFNGQSGVMAIGGGLYYMRARFYSPTDGRFISRDPLGFAGGHNLYAYAGNNPMSLTDPIGLDPGVGLDPGDFVDDPMGAVVYPQEALTEFYGTILGGLAAPGAIVLTGGLALEAGDAAGALLTTVGPGGATLVDVYDVYNAIYTAAVRSPIVGFVFGALGLNVNGQPLEGAGGEFKLWANVGKLTAKAISSGILADLAKLAASKVTNLSALIGSYLFKGPEDPNSIFGPGGVGSQHFVPINQLPYVITFDNKATADAPAQVVTVTEQLDANLDWSTFQLADFDFGGQVFSVPPGLTSYSTRIDARNTVGVYVDVDADFDPLTGLLTWTFTSIDPTTLDVPVGNVEEGFLPPDATPPDGEGFVAYVVQPKVTDPTGTVINAKATVIFQAGLPNQSSLDTPTIFNTIDNGPPTSSVNPLPADSPASFTVSWAGKDDPGGSGVGWYNIYVSDNGGPFTLWLSATTQTSAKYTGQNGHTYGFYSVATDKVGNPEATPTASQATTSVDAIPPTSTVSPLPATQIAPSFTLNWSGQDNPGGSGIASYNIYVSDDGGPFTELLAHTTHTSTTFTGQVGHTYGFYSVATDNAGNVEATPSAAEAKTTIVIALTSITPASPSPRNTPVSFIDVTFNEPILLSTFTSSALLLTDNGGPNLVTAAAIISPVSGSTYQIGGLSGLTAKSGEYTLSVSATGIRDANGNAGSNSLSTSWLMDVSPPTSTIVPLSPRQAALTFPVSVTGSDAGSPPSGLASFDIWASTNGGPWTFWTNVPPSAPTATFTGQSNTTYSFYSVAQDLAGNVQADNPFIEASTYVPDLTPPVTFVNSTTGADASSVNASTATFTLNVTGSDQGGSGLAYFEVFVQVDQNPVQQVGPAIPAGAPDSSGDDHATAIYQGLSDGQPHTYRFYSIGIDGAGNVEAAPASTGNVIFSQEVFTQPSQLQVTGFTVEHGSPSRSYIRYLDLTFDESDSQSGNDLTAIINSIGTPSPDILIYKYDLNGDASSKTAVPLSSPTNLTVLDHAIEIDFGSGGIGGNPNTTAADGYYEVDIKLPDGQTAVHHFYRLLGDVNGDGMVDENDLNAISADIGESSPLGWTPLSADVTGGGTVTTFDYTLATRAKGHKLGAGLSLG